MTLKFLRLKRDSGIIVYTSGKYMAYLLTLTLFQKIPIKTSFPSSYSNTECVFNVCVKSISYQYLQLVGSTSLYVHVNSNSDLEMYQYLKSLLKENKTKNQQKRQVFREEKPHTQTCKSIPIENKM